MEYLRVLLPSIVVGLLFWYVLRAIIKSDSTERKEMDRYYAQMEVRRAEQAQGDDISENLESEDNPRKDTDNGTQSRDGTD